MASQLCNVSKINYNNKAPVSSKYQKELKHLLYGSHLPNITITIIFISIPIYYRFINGIA